MHACASAYYASSACAPATSPKAPQSSLTVSFWTSSTLSKSPNPYFDHEKEGKNVSFIELVLCTKYLMQVYTISGSYVPDTLQAINLSDPGNEALMPQCHWNSVSPVPHNQGLIPKPS